MMEIDQAAIEKAVNDTEYSPKIKEKLIKFPVLGWKRAAKMTGPVNLNLKRDKPVERYDLKLVAQTILLYDFKIEKTGRKDEKHVYGVATIKVGDHFELLAGIMVGKDLYLETNSKIEKMVVNANDVELFMIFESYAQLVYFYPEFRRTVTMFNKIIKHVESL